MCVCESVCVRVCVRVCERASMCLCMYKLCLTHHIISMQGSVPC